MSLLISAEGPVSELRWQVRFTQPGQLEVKLQVQELVNASLLWPVS